MEALIVILNTFIKQMLWLLLGLLFGGLILEFGQLLLVWYEYRIGQRISGKQAESEDPK